VNTPKSEYFLNPPIGTKKKKTFLWCESP